MCGYRILIFSLALDQLYSHWMLRVGVRIGPFFFRGGFFIRTVVLS